MNFVPKKSLGQNFLLNKEIINNIVELGKITEETIVIEIGPWTGNLTEEILKKKPKKFFAIEKDKNLAVLLQAEFNNKINIINEDILNINENIISNEELIVFGNLPYNISTEILCKWILNLNDEKIWFNNLILMFQKEVADRIISNYNCSNYGRLSILTNWRLKVKKICDVTPDCFSPRPKINSSILYFEPKNNFIKIKDPKNLEKISRVFFSQRRKMLKKPFNHLFNGDQNVLDKLKINLKLRPQNLDPDTYYQLVCEYEKLRS